MERYRGASRLEFLRALPPPCAPFPLWISNLTSDNVIPVLYVPYCSEEFLNVLWVGALAPTFGDSRGVGFSR